MRAFSTIEILIALAILTTTVVTVALVAFGTPFMLANMRLESTALYNEDATLSRTEHIAWSAFDRLSSLATSSQGDFQQSLSISPIEDELSSRAYSYGSWKDAYSQPRSSSLWTTLTSLSAEDPCDPFVSGDWTIPRTKLYSLSVGDLLPSTVPADTYPIADLKAIGNALLVAVRTTTLTSSPTLFFFDIASSTQKPAVLGNGFDNASSSRVGFTAVTAGGGYAYAANGFGSGSAQTCAEKSSCAQLKIFSLPGTTQPKFVGALSLATTTAPYAISSGGSTAPATAIAHSNALIYLGLQKTLSGDEFTIIDVHDPQKPKWLSGIPIGRSVNQILVRDGLAYVSTDDNTRELMVIDVHDSLHPFVVGTWDAPGSTGFGFGSALRAQGARLLFGRSYVSNASELYALDVQDSYHIMDTAHADLGTARNTDSLRRFLSQSFLTFALTTKTLQFWTLADADTLSEFAPRIVLPAGFSGTALACRENTLYVGLEHTTQASGVVEVLTSS